MTHTPTPDHQTVLLTHPSPDIYGSDRMLIESVQALADSYRVVVALPQDGPLVSHLRAAGAEVVIVRFPVLRKSVMSPLGVAQLAGAAALALPRLLRLIRRCRAAALYVNTVTIPIWIIAARLTRVPVVCHVHEAEESAGRPVRWALTLPVRLASTVVANSRASLGALEAAGLRNRERALVIYNGVAAPDEITPIVRSDPRRLVLVGRLSPRKGTDVALAATLLLRQQGYPVTLTLVGGIYPGYEWFEDQLRQAAGGSEAIFFAGMRDPIWPALAHGDIVLVPSRWEPFGNVAVEAMLAGRPVIASAVQGLTEIVRDGQTGLLVPAEDPQALAAAVAVLLRDWPRAIALADAAREDALARFSAVRYRSEILAMVNDLSRSGSPGGGDHRWRSAR